MAGDSGSALDGMDGGGSLRQPEEKIMQLGLFEQKIDTAIKILVDNQTDYHIVIQKADFKEKKAIVQFIDGTFTKEGYGFVSSAQIDTEIRKGRVFLAKDGDKICGVRVGINRVYNLVVHPEYRGCGIGRMLIEVHPPETIRVKAQPIGNLSKEQIKNFKTPRGFYEKLGFIFSHLDYAKNFFQKASVKAVYHKQGGKKHIEVYKNKIQKQRKFWEND